MAGKKNVGKPSVQDAFTTLKQHSKLSKLKLTTLKDFLPIAVQQSCRFL